MVFSKNRISLLLLLILCNCSYPDFKLVTGYEHEKKIRISSDSLITNIFGNFPFQTKDSIEFSKLEYDDSDWKRVRIPGAWHMRGYDYDGAVWHRIHFTYDSKSISGNLGVMTPYVDLAYEAFINGQKIHSQGQISKDGKLITAGSQNSFFSIPRELLQENGENVLAFRVAGLGGMGGFAFTDFYIGEENVVRAHFESYLMTIAFYVAVFLFAGIYHIILYISRKKEKSYLYFGLLSIVVFFHIATIKTISYWYIDNSWINLYINVVGLLLLPFFISRFNHEFFGYKERTFSYSLYAIMLFLFCWLTVLFIGLHYNEQSWARNYSFFWKYNIPIILVAIIASNIQSIIINFRGLRQKKFGAKILLAGNAVWAFVIVRSLMSFVGWIPEGVVNEVGYLAVILSMASAMSLRFANVYRETDRLNLELAKKNKDLESLDKMKDEFLANTSHELRTPLNGIIGLAESMADGSSGDLPVKVMANLMFIVASAKRLGSLVNDILDFSKLKNHQLEIQMKEVDMDVVANIVIKNFQYQSQFKKLELKNEIPENFPTVLGDENRLQQILFNLVGNAFKFTERGYIKITGDVHKNQLTSMAKITVSDTGIGIPEEKLSDIFKSFEQVDASISRNYGGTGLGLSITKQLVELHGGELWVESKLGRGSDFHFTIPFKDAVDKTKLDSLKFRNRLEKISEEDLVEAQIDVLNASYDIFAEFAEANNEKGEKTPERSHQKSKVYKILAVDDEPINLQVIQNHFYTKEYELVKALNGIEAVKIIKDGFFPDLMLLDVMMPKVSGYDVCKAVRKQYSLYELPVLMLTAKNQVHDIVEGFNSGANDYLMKPFDRKELLARVETLITMKNAVASQSFAVMVSQELKIAKNIQKSILPNRMPENKNWKVAVKYQPMQSIGGDFFDFCRDEEGGLGVIVADVSGHGVPAALISAMLKVAFSSAREYVRDPVEMLHRIFFSLQDKLGGNFITISYFYISPDAKSMIHANAGHPAILIHRKGSNEFLVSRPKGCLLGGLSKTLKFETSETKIQPNDRIIFYTDGVTESRNPSGVMIDEEGLRKFMQNHSDMSLELVPETLEKHILNWIERKEFEDDFTFGVVEIL